MKYRVITQPCIISTDLNIDGWKRFSNIVVKLKQRKIILEHKQGSNVRIKKNYDKSMINKKSMTSMRPMIATPKHPTSLNNRQTE